MGLRTSRDLIEYRSTDWAKDRPSQQIPIQWTACQFGGQRPWLTCLCGRRVGKLYYHGGYSLSCRQCGEMIYESQREGRRGRLHLKATRMRARMGDYGRPGIDAIPRRPKRMRQATYARLRAEIQLIEYRLTEGRLYRPRPPTVNRYRIAMSALRLSIPQFQT